MAQTSFSNQCSILSELWLDYRDDEEFQDFIEYNDLGLPLAYAFANGIVEQSSIGEGFVTEAFGLLLAGLDVEDTGFDNLQDILELDTNNG
jgi:hypothetical protein